MRQEDCEMQKKWLKREVMRVKIAGKIRVMSEDKRVIRKVTMVKYKVHVYKKGMWYSMNKIAFEENEM